MNRFLRKFLPDIIPSPPIALLTDFGLSDHYVGTMKGVISSVSPRVRIIDITHLVRPQGIREAAYLLWSSYRYFPAGTVFVVVVDPGVGSSRDILLLQVAARWFLVPDNGVMDFILHTEPVNRAFMVNTLNSPYTLGSVSATFHGRDIFAPVAAYVARGVSPDLIGIPSKPPTGRLSLRRRPDRKATVLHIDHFGNIVTDLLPDEGDKPASLWLNGKGVRRWIGNYTEGPAETPCMIRGSSGLVEIVVKNGNAAERMKIRSNATIKVMWS